MENKRDSLGFTDITDMKAKAKESNEILVINISRDG
jgi:hypothetical protein